MYDTIVIGNDLSSLIAATMTSRHGSKTVLLSEADDKCIYKESGYTFHIDPLPLTGFGSEQICSLLFSSLGAHYEEFPVPRLLNPGFQIILPDHRIDFFTDKEKLLKEIEREFPSHAEDIRKIYLSVSDIHNFFEQWIRKNLYLYPYNYKELISCIKNIPGLIKERWRLSKTLQAIKKDPSLYRVFGAHRLLFSNLFQDFHIQANILTTNVLSLPLGGIYYHEHGKELLFQSLRSMFIKFGGHLISNCSVKNVSVQKEVNIDIETDSKLSTIRGKYLITSTKWEKFDSLLLNYRKFRRLKRSLKSLHVSRYPFTLHMGVFEKGIPEMMATYVAILGNSGNKEMDDGVVFVESSFSGEIERAPAGKRALSATVHLKESPMTLADDELRNTCTSIFQSLDAFLPFLRENLDYINIDKSIENSRKYQHLVNLKYEMQTAPFLGFKDISPRTPVRNVFITGGILLAGLGFEGEIMSGVNAAMAIIEQEE